MLRPGAAFTGFLGALLEKAVFILGALFIAPAIAGFTPSFIGDAYAIGCRHTSIPVRFAVTSAHWVFHCRAYVWLHFALAEAVTIPFVFAAVQVGPATITIVFARRRRLADD